MITIWRSVIIASVLSAAASATGCALEPGETTDGNVGRNEQAVIGWIGPVSEENNALFPNYASCAGANTAVRAAQCTGKYCDNVYLQCFSVPSTLLQSWFAPNARFDTAFFSEEGTASGFCGQSANQIDGVVTGIRASGQYADFLALECTRLVDPQFFANRHCTWSGWHSEEGGGLADFPEGYVAVGAKCQGAYCDLINWRICNIQ
jgi:hypothetical protein